MGKHWRRRCEGTPCRDPSFFHAARAPVGADPFFKPPAAAAGPAPALQREDAPHGTDEKKDPLFDGLKTVGEHLAEHEPLKKWAEPTLDHLKLTLWDRASPADKAAMLAFLGVNAGIGAAAFAGSPQLRSDLSGVNIGKPLGWIPYSPVAGFKYKLAEPGKTALGLSADVTLDPYLDLLKKSRHGFPISGVKFGLESNYEPASHRFGVTGGSFGMDFFGGALKAEGKTFRELSPYPQLVPGGGPGAPPTWLMNEEPGMPSIKKSGKQFMLNADLLKLFPWLRKNF